MRQSESCLSRWMSTNQVEYVTSNLSRETAAFSGFIQFPLEGWRPGRLCKLTNYYGHAIGFAGADKSAVGTINRPLQAFCPRSRCPGYFVNVHNRAPTDSTSLRSSFLGNSPPVSHASETHHRA